MLKITGLDDLAKSFMDAQRAFQALNGELGSVRFDPDDPSSIEAAIRKAEELIDERVGCYASNPLVGQLVDGAKAQFRQGLIDRAMEARLKGHQGTQ